MPALACELLLVGNQCDNTQFGITDIQVDITFIIPKLIDAVPTHAKGAK